MAKTILLLIFTFFWATQGEIARITFVKGSVINQTTKRKLLPNDSFNTDDKLLFEKGSELKYRTRVGEFVVKATDIKPSTATGMLLSAASAIAKPANRINTAGMRGGYLTNRAILQSSFSGGGTPKNPNKVLVIGKSHYEINIPEYEMNEEQFFVVKYVYKGEMINKRLPFEGKELILDKEAIYTIDNQPITAEETSAMTLNFYRQISQDNAEMEYITDFDPVFVDEQTIKLEIRAIVETMEGETAENILREVLSHLLDSYGYPDETDVKKILSTEHNIKF